jgi:hypothetical protein
MRRFQRVVALSDPKDIEFPQQQQDFIDPGPRETERIVPNIQDFLRPSQSEPSKHQLVRLTFRIRLYLRADKRSQ